MNYEYEITKLHNEVDSLREAFLQSQRNQVPITEKVDTTSNNVTSITPTTYTKTAYIGDTEVTFTDVVFGNLNVYINNSDGYYPDYKVSRNNDRITIVFDAPLLYVTTVTISIL